MINVLIPAAGEGKRFAEAGYDKPKPLIDVLGKPMLVRVMECLTPKNDTVAFWPIVRDINVPVPNGIHLSEPTQGAVDTLLKAEPYITRGPVLVANCDQWLARGVIDDFLTAAVGHDAQIMVFPSTNPHHSYARIANDRVTEVVEKQVISDDALVGIYYFADSAVLFDYCRKVIANNLRHDGNGEFYISAALNLYVQDGGELVVYEVGAHEKGMLGTPEGAGDLHCEGCGRSGGPVNLLMGGGDIAVNGIIPVVGGKVSMIDVTRGKWVFDEIEQLKPNTVINCAGVSYPGNVGDHLSYFTELNVNLLGSFHIASAAVRNNVSNMIFIASVAGLHGKPNHAAYSASKAGVISLVQSLAFEGHNAYAISPGRVDTKMREKDYPGEDPETRLKPTQIGEVVRDILDGKYEPGDNIIIRKQGFVSFTNVDKGMPWRDILKIGQPALV